MEKKIEDIIANFKGNFHILEKKIDLEEQMVYFNKSKHLKKFMPDNVLDMAESLWNDEVPDEQRKKILIWLASLQEVKAYRIIEDFFYKITDEGLKNWSYLALIEARMGLESALSDEKQIFISTGLGGRGQMLRYFIVLFPHDKEKGFSDFERDFVRKEFEFVLNLEGCEFELRETKDSYVSFVALIPIDILIKDIVVKIFNACNQFGKFISDKFIITNVKEMDENEIFEFIDNGDDVEDLDEIDIR